MAIVRSFCLSALLLAACSTTSAPDPRYLPYNGYGSTGATIADEFGYMPSDMLRGDAVGTVDIRDIASSLDRFLLPAGDQLILLPHRLDKSKLDFSLDSLKIIDQWLTDIHTINKLQAEVGKAGELLISDGRGDNSVMFAGLYLGEVIRANSQLPWRWERFDRFVEANPYFTEHYGYDAGLDTFVLIGPQGVATPINTALKRVLVGKEESLHFIGTLLVDPVDLNAAVSGQNFYGLSDIQ